MNHRQPPLATDTLRRLRRSSTGVAGWRFLREREMRVMRVKKMRGCLVICTCVCSLYVLIERRE
ncbi:hypothetical protein Hanom_Chr01g00057171 [Helianthus anomalus]